MGRLILGFSGAGILALFVLDPIREKLETQWIRKVARWYYVILLPMVVVLVLALWRRISEYGVTEDRYIGVAIAAWLAFIAVYFLFSRTKSIRMIPASLCVWTLLISLGPWGMFSVSERSQVDRLKQILTADSILVDGKVQTAPSPVLQDDKTEILSILNYLHQVHGFAEIQPWFDESLSHDSLKNGTRFKSPGEVAELMGLDVEYAGRFFTTATDPANPISISGYDYFLRAQYGGLDPKPKLEGCCDSLRNLVTATADSVIIQFSADSAPPTLLEIPVHSFIAQAVLADTLHRRGHAPVEQAVTEYETVDFRTRLVLVAASVRVGPNGVVRLQSYELLILYSRKGESK